MPLISIIVPAYNYAQYLPETINSIINQSFQDWECLIVNDGSTDNTESVAKIFTEKDNRIKYFYKTNGGLSSARNHGLKYAEGKYVCFLDADDILESDYFKNSSTFLESLNEESVVFEKFIKFFDDGEKDYEWYKDYNYKVGLQEKYYERLVDKNSIPPCAPMLNLSIIKNNNFIFDEKLTSYEDWDFWLQVSEKYKFYFIDKENSAAKIRFHSNSMSTNQFRMDYNQLIVRLKLQNKLKQKELTKINNKWIESCIKTLLYTIADNLDNHLKNDALTKLNKIIEIYPHLKIRCLKNTFLLKNPKLFRKTAWILLERFLNIVNKK